MNKSKLFKLAHKLTKKVIKGGDNYRVTFGAALKIVKAAYFGKQEATLKEWSKNGQRRIYINYQAKCQRFGDMTEFSAGFLLINKDGSADYSNVKEEFAIRIQTAVEALSVYHQTVVAMVLGACISF